MFEQALTKRTYVYIQRPCSYLISGCPMCGNLDSEWSEYRNYMWCSTCNIDFLPEDSGIFDGPVPIKVCYMMGLYFDVIDLNTGEIRSILPNEPVHFKLVNCRLEFIPESVPWETVLSPLGRWVPKRLAEAMTDL
jgi:hypothetical protein